MNWLAIIIGALVALAGLGVLGAALRKRDSADDPKAKAMLIAGTMATAFGLILAGFAVAYGAAAPLDYSGSAQ